MSAWGQWSQCSETCGPGYQTTSRNVQASPLHGGTACPSEEPRIRDCNTATCTGAYATIIYKNWHIYKKKCSYSTSNILCNAILCSCAIDWLDNVSKTSVEPPTATKLQFSIHPEETTPPSNHGKWNFSSISFLIAEKFTLRALKVFCLHFTSFYILGFCGVHTSSFRDKDCAFSIEGISDVQSCWIVCTGRSIYNMLWKPDHVSDNHPRCHCVHNKIDVDTCSKHNEYEYYNINPSDCFPGKINLLNIR